MIPTLGEDALQILLWFAMTFAIAVVSLLSYQEMAKHYPTLPKSSPEAPIAITLKPLLSEDSADDTPSTNDAPKRLHVIILVHGWVGCPNDLAYMHQALEEEAAKIAQEQSSSGGESFYVYTCTSNHGRTNDGIQVGADRIASEIWDLLSAVQDQNIGVREISLSIVGYSLGGLYSRYALPKLLPPDDDDERQNPRIVPKVFCTVATPHLGSSGHMWMHLPRFLERWIGWSIATGRDLFHLSPHIEDTVTDPHWVEPLLRFEKRIAYANTYAMDLMVPTSTAAFLSDRSDSQHFFKPSPSCHEDTVTTEKEEEHNSSANHPFIALVVETRPNHELLKQHSPPPNFDMTRRLDAMGWTKVFVDFTDSYDRDGMKKPVYASSELHAEFNRSKRRLFLPVGHDLIAANSKNVINSYANRGGRPVVDLLAKYLVRDIVYGASCPAGADATCTSS